MPTPALTTKLRSVDNASVDFRGSQVKGSVTAGDALVFLQSIRKERADIVFLDPPFNLGKEYGARRKRLDALDPSEYEQWLKRILVEAVRILRPGGTLYLYHLPIWGLRFGSYLDGELQFRHWIAISMKNGFIRGRRLYPAHYALLMFTKGEPTRLSRPKLKPARCRHCGDYVKDYGGYLSIIESKGINLSDFWDDLSPVRHSGRKYRRANELPAVLFERVIEISGSPRGLYVDPFAGTGSGVIAAVRHGLRFAACDLVAANCRLISSRLRKLQNELRSRNTYA
jgi:site-specific DNA-methyltransferase (adenine-specific)